MTLPTIATAAAQVFRDYNTDGVAGSGEKTPLKSDARTLFAIYEAALNASLTRIGPIINGYLTWTTAANVLTVALKTNAGANPSAGDPVYVDLRNSTQGSGAPSILAITAALSLVVSAGSKVGFADAINGRLWGLIFNDAGTPRIGVFNAYGGNASAVTPFAYGTIHPLMPSMLASSTAEGGAGAADSAGVIYTDSAVASKAFVVAGFAAWETTMATAGNWSANPDVVHMQRLGDPLPGEIVQRQASFDSAVASGTTTTPFDDTIPQSTEGNQFMTLAVTPRSKCNLLEIEHEANYAASAAVNIIVALHQDAVANALVAKAMRNTAAADPSLGRILHRMLAATVSSTTFKIRAGGSAASTVAFNGSAAATRTFGGVNYGRLEVVERMA